MSNESSFWRVFGLALNGFESEKMVLFGSCGVLLNRVWKMFDDDDGVFGFGVSGLVFGCFGVLVFPIFVKVVMVVGIGGVLSFVKP